MVATVAEYDGPMVESVLQTAPPELCGALLELLELLLISLDELDEVDGLDGAEVALDAETLGVSRPGALAVPHAVTVVAASAIRAGRQMDEARDMGEFLTDGTKSGSRAPVSFM